MTLLSHPPPGYRMWICATVTSPLAHTCYYIYIHIIRMHMNKIQRRSDNLMLQIANSGCKKNRNPFYTRFGTSDGLASKTAMASKMVGYAANVEQLRSGRHVLGQDQDLHALKLSETRKGCIVIFGHPSRAHRCFLG
jgi:hypothetical protein